MGKYKVDFRIVIHCSKEAIGDNFKEAIINFRDESDEDIMNLFFTDKLKVESFDIQRS